MNNRETRLTGFPETEKEATKEMMQRLMRMHRKQAGITGLETAIILIAFVVVAAVFAYTVLSAGLFSTQKSQEAVYSGLEETQSTLEMRGSVVAYRDTLNSGVGQTGSVGKIDFTIALASQGGEVVDVTPPYAMAGGALVQSGLEPQVQIAFNDSQTVITEVPWTVSFIGKDDSDYDLEEGEKAVITVWLHTYDGAAWGDGVNPPFMGALYIDTDHQFTLEVKPSKGAVLNIQRTTPAFLDTVCDLH
jgi:flagellin FlaB